MTGLGKEGMLKFEDLFDCLDVVLVAGEAECPDTDNKESEFCDGRPCPWNAVQAENVGELGVNDARRVWIRRFGINDDALGGRDDL